MAMGLKQAPFKTCEVSLISNIEDNHVSITIHKAYCDSSKERTSNEFEGHWQKKKRIAQEQTIKIACFVYFVLYVHVIASSQERNCIP